MVQFNTVGDRPEKNQIIRNEERGGLNEKAGLRTLYFVVAACSTLNKSLEIALALAPLNLLIVFSNEN